MGKDASRPVVRIRFLWTALLLATGATLIFAACGGTSTAPAQPGLAPTRGVTTFQSSPVQTQTPVAVVNAKMVEKNGQYAFDPATLSIKVGTEVIWTNDTNAPHTVTSNTGVFNSDILATKQTFMLIFTKPGTYTYYCNIHLYMKGTIIVTV